MTEKKQRILETALRLFATQGYASTPTSRIAREAGVSEGLIFQHFGSKEGLLHALIEESVQEIARQAAKVIAATEPREVLARAIEVPLELWRGSKEFWQLQYSIKYQKPELARLIDESEPMRLLLSRVQEAFQALGYRNPAAETRLLFIIVNGVFQHLMSEDEIVQEAFVRFLKQKYGLDT